VNAFILAGGQSTRMGRDKALLQVGGEALVERMSEALCGMGMNPRICGSRPDLARFAEVVPDNFPLCGPLGGIEAALTVSESDLNLFVPVDLPCVPPGFLRWMMGRSERSRALATIPHYAGRPQPLCAVYSRRLLEGLRGFLASGNLRVMVAVRQSARKLGESTDEFDVESVAATSPAEWPSDSGPAAWFTNVNTPADYQALQAMSGAKGRHPIS
jgi:molybdopterin-guanine dinucleotide biosynthesis protein A